MDVAIKLERGANLLLAELVGGAVHHRACGRITPRNEGRTLAAVREGRWRRLGTVRCLGTFLPDPVEVPMPVVDYVARQLDVADPSCLKGYARRERTRLEHQWEIAGVYGYRDFASAEAELAKWVEARAWTTGEGPRTIFNGSVAWLRERRVLLPGVTVLTRLVAATRDAATQRSGTSWRPR